MNEASDEARRQEGLVRAALILTSELSLPTVLQKISDLAAELTDAEYAALGVIGPNGRIHEFVTHGVTEEQRSLIGRIPEGHGLLGALISEARPLRLKRLQDDPRSIGFPPNHPPMQSFLGVPVAIRGRVFGNLYLTEKRGAGGFTQEDEDTAVKLAAHAAVAVENARLYFEAQMGQRWLTALNRVSKAILEGEDIDEVLRLVAGNARELVDAAVAAVATPRREHELVIRVVDGDHSETLEGLVFDSESSISADVIRTGEAVVIANAQEDARANHPFVQIGEIGPAIFVPIAVRHRTFGTLAVCNHPDQRKFTQEDLTLVRTFAGQAAVAIEYSRAQEELRRLALVEDRERIAKELHDDIIQSLFAEGMALQASLAMLHDPDAMELRITQSVERIDRVIRDLRNYIFGLQPGAAADRQLDRSLRDLAESFGEAAGVPIEVNTDARAVSRLAGRAADIIQSAREALSNAVRHSGASSIRVGLAASADEAILEIADDGKGFDVKSAEGRGHGLGNLGARADALGATLEIESERGRGTWVRITIPF